MLMPPCMWTFLREEVDRKPVESWLENRSNKHILSLGSYHTADEAVYANAATYMREAACKCHWPDICGRVFKHEILGCILQVGGPLRKLCSAEFWWVWTETKEQCAVEQRRSVLVSEQKTPAHCFFLQSGIFIAKLRLPKSAICTEIVFFCDFVDPWSSPTLVSIHRCGKVLHRWFWYLSCT